MWEIQKIAKTGIVGLKSMYIFYVQGYFPAAFRKAVDTFKLLPLVHEGHFSLFFSVLDIIYQ